MAYTAMGAMVNLASRIEGLNKVYGTQILVSEATRLAAGSGFVFRPIDIVVVKGAAVPVPVHELLGVCDLDAPPELQVRAGDLRSLPAWTDCIAAYRDGRFEAARAALAVVDGQCQIPAAAVYAERLAGLGRAAAPGWTPELQMTFK
jgi:adenylate cyclase